MEEASLELHQLISDLLSVASESLIEMLSEDEEAFDACPLATPANVMSGGVPHTASVTP